VTSITIRQIEATFLDAVKSEFSGPSPPLVVKPPALDIEASLPEVPHGDLIADVDRQQVLGTLKRTRIRFASLLHDADGSRCVRVDRQPGFDTREYLARLIGLVWCAMICSVLAKFVEAARLATASITS
jgi:hypothetical protein